MSLWCPRGLVTERRWPKQCRAKSVHAGLWTSPLDHLADNRQPCNPVEIATEWTDWRCGLDKYPNFLILTATPELVKESLQETGPLRKFLMPCTSPLIDTMKGQGPCCWKYLRALFAFPSSLVNTPSFAWSPPLIKPNGDNKGTRAKEKQDKGRSDLQQAEMTVVSSAVVRQSACPAPWHCGAGQCVVLHIFLGFALPLLQCLSRA